MPLLVRPDVKRKEKFHYPSPFRPKGFDPWKKIKGSKEEKGGKLSSEKM
jgi:hypothetical protein